MRVFFTKIGSFVKGLYNDPDIPKRDKVIFGVCLMLVVSPIDVIPDVIPIIGVIDDFILIATLLDYVFEILDPAILKRHYPWSDKSLERLKRLSKMVSRFAPSSLKNNIWEKASRIADDKMAKTQGENPREVIIDVKKKPKGDPS